MDLMKVELPCFVGDFIYYITAWNKESLQPDHCEKVIKITIFEEEVVFHTEFRTFFLSDFKKTWFTNKDEYEIESNIIRQAYIYEKQLRDNAQSDKNVKERKNESKRYCRSSKEKALN